MLIAICGGGGSIGMHVMRRRIREGEQVAAPGARLEQCHCLEDEQGGWSSRGLGWRSGWPAARWEVVDGMEHGAVDLKASAPEPQLICLAAQFAENCHLETER